MSWLFYFNCVEVVCYMSLPQWCILWLLAALLLLFCGSLCSVRLFLAVSWVDLQSVVVAVPGQTHWHFPLVYLRKHVIPQFNLESYDPLMRPWKGFRDIGIPTKQFKIFFGIWWNKAFWIWIKFGDICQLLFRFQHIWRDMGYQGPPSRASLMLSLLVQMSH